MLPRRNLAKIKLQRVNSAASERADDVVAVEEPLEIRVTFESSGQRVERSISVTMRTPGDDFELAAGFLFNEGLIASEREIHEISYCTGKDEQLYNRVNVRLRSGSACDAERLQRNFFVSSSCGLCGKASIEQVRTAAKVPLNDNRPIVPQAVLMQLPEKLRSKQAVFEKTGGLHGAGLFNAAGELLLLKEDVGRHNAVDKLIGERLLNGKVPLHDSILLVSGRTSFELVQKARMAGIGIVAAVGAPSSLAVELARETGMTLIGFLRADKFNLYTGEHRVKHM
ncbi:MAG TPA: formate dehydrogenase accessory sulfurtransferase FdhD [Planctomycetota bacterium]|nr:formate dehydrogenase accessory sulfurtransferase FdhD [Planctomycetota bacterium]